MITTRRNSSGIYDSVQRDGVAVFERETANFNEPEKLTREESLSEARERMQRNLAKLLNYDKEDQEVAVPAPAEEKAQATETPVINQTSSEEDIRPTTTTMQFGDGDVNQMFNELKESEKNKSSKMDGKTKFALALYAIAITVILALIIINTGVLSVLNTNSELKQAELKEVVGEYQTITEELDGRGDAYVVDVAENTLGMIKR